ncbi:MAG: Ig-like domain-containing protein [Oscillospiraceae bacterium]|nr:Ig-like domain-containing protein [Oscillospiraceae bacterium]
MANMPRKSIAVCLMLLMLLLLLPISPAAAQETYYGEAYNDLPTEQQRTVYRLLEEGIAGLAPIIKFPASVEITYQELSDVIRAVCVDNPQYFWFLETGVTNYDQLKPEHPVLSFEPEYILDSRIISAGSQELADAMYAFHTEVHRIVDGIPVNCTTEYEIALYLHDYLAEHVTYTLEGDHPSAYAALIHGEAACYGYSKAYQCLLNAAGIRARTITGDSDNGDGQLVGHAWNQVWLDGNCYYTDVTWDDQEIFTSHACFAVSLDKISVDHFADPEFILPECDHRQLDYHAINQGSGVGLIENGTTPSQAAAFFRPEMSSEDGSIMFVCHIRFTGKDFLSWFDKNGWDICRLLGLSNAVSIHYYYRNDVYYLQLSDPNFKLKEPAVSSITLSQNEVTLTGSGAQFQLRPAIQSDCIWTPLLVYSSNDESVATVDARGMVTAVSEGTAVITAASADGSVSVGLAVTVSAAPEHVHTMRLFTEKEPTCTQDGHETYYLCTGCGRRFADEAGTALFELTEAYILPATHNRLIYVNDGDYHVQRCKCGVTLSRTKEKHADADADGKCDICNLIIAEKQQNRPGAAGKEAKSEWVTPVVVGAVIVAAGILFFVIRRLRRGY